MQPAAAALLALAALAALAAAHEPIDWKNVKPIYELNPRLQGLRQRLLPAGAPATGRIVGGNEAKPHSLPYQAALLIDTGSGTAFCGGSLLDSQWVLTAAHCAEVAKGVTVILGAHHVQEEEPEQVRLESTDITVHSRWNALTLINDIALVRLPEPVQFNTNIQPIRLPSRADALKDFVKEITLASGWGKDSDEATAISPVLRYVRSPVITKLSCNIRYFGVIQDSHLCTSGSGGHSTCNGDSGGPLVHEEQDGDSTQIGLVSFGIALGCEAGWPAVFTRVTSYLDWLNDKTGIPIRD